MPDLKMVGLFISTLAKGEEVWQRFLAYVAFVIFILIIYQILYLALKKYAKKSDKEWVPILQNYFYRPALSLVLVIALATIYLFKLTGINEILEIYNHLLRIAFVLAATYFGIKSLKGMRYLILSRYQLEGESEEARKGRKLFTQLRLLESIIIFFLVILAVALILMTFEPVRKVGISLLASAGVFGVILGFSAQKFIGTVFAGIQIAWAQPIRIGDVVIIMGHWGKVEEISLTHIVVKTWDHRQVIVPINWIIDNPFENWTKISSDLYGVVFLYSDYGLVVNEVRAKVAELVKDNPWWDGNKCEVQVTNLNDRTMETRILVSAENADNAWDLRCYLREELIAWLQKEHPELLPKTRIDLNK